LFSCEWFFQSNIRDTREGDELLKEKGWPNYLIGIAVAGVAPLVFGLAGPFWVHELFLIAIFGIMAVSLNLILGYTGQGDLAHGVLFGIGGYTSGLLVMRLGVNFWVTIPIAGIAAVIVGFVVAYATLRLRGVYFALATFAFTELMLEAYINLRGITEGLEGLMPIPKPSIAGLTLGPQQKIIWVYIAIAFLLFTVFITDRIVHSRVGRAFIAIRDDQDLAESAGINTFWYKMLSFCIATFFAGIAGALYASYHGMMSPGDCNIMFLFLIIVACVSGGLGTLLGPVLGAVFVIVVPELLRVAEVYYYLIFGGVLIIITIFAPKGIMGVVTLLQNWLRARIARQ
jgi:branched-chain amino acid transport system permease protein